MTIKNIITIPATRFASLFLKRRRNRIWADQRKTEEGSEAILHKRFWIWDAVWKEPREVEIVRRQAGPDGFLCWDSEEVEARGSKGTHLLHQIFSKKQLFQTKNALCKHYIKKFEKFMDKEEQK